MVEKIIINPAIVRGYGNIIGAKDSTDYDTSDCTITEGTDTINGEQVTIMTIEYDE